MGPIAYKFDKSKYKSIDCSASHLFKQVARFSSEIGLESEYIRDLANGCLDQWRIGYLGGQTTSLTSLILR